MKLSVILSFLPIASVLSAPIILYRGHGKRVEHNDIAPMLNASPKNGIIEAGLGHDGAVGALIKRDVTVGGLPRLNGLAGNLIKSDGAVGGLLNNVAGKDGLVASLLENNGPVGISQGSFKPPVKNTDDTVASLLNQLASSKDEKTTGGILKDVVGKRGLESDLLGGGGVVPQILKGGGLVETLVKDTDDTVASSLNLLLSKDEKLTSGLLNNIVGKDGAVPQLLKGGGLLRHQSRILMRPWLHY